MFTPSDQNKQLRIQAARSRLLRRGARGTGEASIGREGAVRFTRFASCLAGVVIMLALGFATAATAATVTSVSAGHEIACALYAEGTVGCWGADDLGGNGLAVDSSTPVLVRGMNSATAISVGEFSACALLAGGKIECWGVNLFGELGNGSDVEFSPTPVVVSGVSDAIAVSVGLDDACALLAAGTVECWGGNTWGELGNGTTTESSTPVAVDGLSNVVSISAGFEDNCALLSTGTVECWGNNAQGELGNGTETSSSTPVAVTGLTNAIAVSGGLDQTCAILSGATADCWGALEGGASTTPVPVSGLSKVVAISSGLDRICAGLSDGTAECWGHAFLGNGTADSSSTPVIVSGPHEVVGISAGWEDPCAVLSDGRAECWGSNASEDLGDGTNTESRTPVLVNEPVAAPTSSGPEPVPGEGGAPSGGSGGTASGGATGGTGTTGNSTPFHCGCLPTPPSPIRPKPISSAVAFALPPAKQCVSKRRFTIHVRTLPGITWTSAVIKIDRKRVKSVGRSHITALVNLVGLPKGTFVLSITAKASNGQAVTGTRTYHTCVPKSNNSYPTPRL
jgi:alpha-tubulin suppressor-like RCC1 family protein